MNDKQWASIPAIIPAKIVADRTISSEAKIMYGQIVYNLCENGANTYCLDVSDQISLTELIKCGYINMYEDGQLVIVTRAEKSAPASSRPPAPPSPLPATLPVTPRNPPSIITPEPSIARTKTPVEEDPEIQKMIADLPENVRKGVEQWLAYKREKRQTYKKIGLKNFLAKVGRTTSEFGIAAVVVLINDTIANNWQGVPWEKLERQRQAVRNRGKATRSRFDGSEY